MGETVWDFGDPASKVVSATCHTKIKIRVDTLPVELLVIHAIKEYHWRWTKKILVV